MPHPVPSQLGLLVLVAAMCGSAGAGCAGAPAADVDRPAEAVTALVITGMTRTSAGHL